MNRVREGRRSIVAVLLLTSAIAIGGFTNHPAVDAQEGVLPITTNTIQENASVKYCPSDELPRLGLEHFNRGNFGMAEQFFRDVVEKTPKDSSA